MWWVVMLSVFITCTLYFCAVAFLILRSGMSAITPTLLSADVAGVFIGTILVCCIDLSPLV